MEVAKQLSKDSYGAGEVPISSEVLSLLYSQQQLIAEQEKRMSEYERQISQSHAQEFTITQVDKKMSSVSESKHDLQSVANQSENPYSAVASQVVGRAIAGGQQLLQVSNSGRLAASHSSSAGTAAPWQDAVGSAAGLRAAHQDSELSEVETGDQGAPQRDYDSQEPSLTQLEMSSIAAMADDDLLQSNSGSTTQNNPIYRKGKQTAATNSRKQAQQQVKVFEDTMCSELASLIDQIESVPKHHQNRMQRH